jgi:hypothetical protein
VQERSASSSTALTLDKASESPANGSISTPRSILRSMPLLPASLYNDGGFPKSTLLPKWPAGRS